MAERRHFNREELVAIIQSLSGFPPEGVKGYLIGGFAMALMDAKARTKDVDIVFENDRDAAEFVSALERVGFLPKEILSEEYLKLQTRNVMVDSEGRQFDIFVNVVCNSLNFSNAMKERATKRMEIDTLVLYTASPEDIILFKGITTRPDDITDMHSLTAFGTDWTIIENELKTQQDHWQYLPTFYRNLEILRDDHDIDSPSLESLKDEAELCMAIALLVQRFGGREFTREQAMAALEDADGGFTDRVMERMGDLGNLLKKGDKFVPQL